MSYAVTIVLVPMNCLLLVFFDFLPDMKCQETKIPKVKAPTPKTPNTIIDGKHSTYSV